MKTEYILKGLSDISQLSQLMTAVSRNVSILKRLLTVVILVISILS